MEQGASRTSIGKLVQAIDRADAVVVGAGAGLSTAAGLTYAGERFERYFADFIKKYHFTDMYTAGFYPFPSLEEQWAYWSRHIWYNRYVDAPKDTYEKLLQVLQGKDFFVITTNVDHRFQVAGFPKERLFYTQGDYGLWQCSVPCHTSTYDNFDTVKAMVEQQQGMKVPTSLVPICPRCGEPMSMNLRADHTFVEDEGWHKASERFSAYLNDHAEGAVLYLELGVGANTPGIIKYPFWRLVAANPQTTYACINLGQIYAPSEISAQSILIDADIDEVISDVLRIRIGAGT